MVEESPFLQKSEALAYFRKRDYIGSVQDEVAHATGQRGLACECCTNYCDYEELQEYCVDPTDVGTEYSLAVKRKPRVRDSKTFKFTKLNLSKLLQNFNPVSNMRDYSDFTDSKKWIKTKQNI